MLWNRVNKQDTPGSVTCAVFTVISMLTFASVITNIVDAFRCFWAFMDTFITLIDIKTYINAITTETSVTFTCKRTHCVVADSTGMTRVSLATFVYINTCWIKWLSETSITVTSEWTRQIVARRILSTIMAWIWISLSRNPRTTGILRSEICNFTWFGPRFSRFLGPCPFLDFRNFVGLGPVRDFSPWIPVFEMIRNIRHGIRQYRYMSHPWNHRNIRIRNHLVYHDTMSSVDMDWDQLRIHWYHRSCKHFPVNVHHHFCPFLDHICKNNLHHHFHKPNHRTENTNVWKILQMIFFENDR